MFRKVDIGDMLVKPNVDVGYQEGLYKTYVGEDIRKAFTWVIWHMSMKPFIDMVSDFKKADKWIWHMSMKPNTDIGYGDCRYMSRTYVYEGKRDVRFEEV